MENNLINRIISSSPESLPLVKAGLLDDHNWQLAGVPLGNGNFWMYQDRNARVSLVDDVVEIDIQRFSNSHDEVQIFDNPKQLYLTKSGYEPGSDGVIAFSCMMKAKIINGDSQDYRDGFCAFNVLDFSSAMVFDIVSNGSKIWAIYERLLIPGLTSPDQAFTHLISINRCTSTEEFLQCLIVYDRNNDRTDYYIDNKLIYCAEHVPLKIDRLQAGFGLITLHPIQNGKSRSCRGQGGRGVWSGFNIYKV